MNKLPILAVTLVSCDLLPSPMGRDDTWQTLCDGCHSDTTTPPATAGAVFLVRITAGAPAVASEGDRWAGTEGELLGAVLTLVGDLDDDGLSDLSARTWGPGILRSTDAPGVRFAVLDAEPTQLGDIDGDGRPDLDLYQYQGSAGSVLPGAELAVGGAFAVGDGWPVTPKLAFGGAAPDVDRDGLADTLWVAQDWPASRGTRLRLVLGAAVVDEVPLATAAVEWVVQRDAQNGGGSWDIGDVDGDGARDLAIGEHVGYDHTAGGRLTVYSGAALAAGQVDELATVRTPDDGGEYRLFDVVPLGDLDLDGRADLAVTWGSAGHGELARIVGGAELGTGDLDQIGRDIPFGGPYVDIDGRDLDGDGLAELLVHDVYGEDGGVFTGADLAAGLTRPTWRYSAATAAVLAGLDPEGRLVIWAADSGAE